eukprot:15006626-Alexandrium_andersonii.AAC.1
MELRGAAGRCRSLAAWLGLEAYGLGAGPGRALLDERRAGLGLPSVGDAQPLRRAPPRVHGVAVLQWRAAFAVEDLSRNRDELAQAQSLQLADASIAGFLLVSVLASRALDPTQEEPALPGLDASVPRWAAWAGGRAASWL